MPSFESYQYTQPTTGWYDPHAQECPPEEHPPVDDCEPCPPVDDCEEPPVECPPAIDILPIYQYSAVGEDGETRYHYSPKPNVGNGWTENGKQFFAYGKNQPGIVPVYQYYAIYPSNCVKYHYSTNPYVKNGWKLDGIAFYAYKEQQSCTVAVYQYCIPDSDGGIKYFYSTDPHIVKKGWEKEGAVFYVVERPL
ncbi:MAG: hypothetical protein HC769_32565 [Cyanobacteria bacterium CRU_2_1]|nr:hypothetical protein [Cyanobacteria bacterium RU_5_0]NJR63106.1 hypothetical protein [Cyanobacteria bacterium CRU_2_1]